MAAAGALVLGALALQTFIQVSHWKNTETLFRHALAVTQDNGMAHTALANGLFREGRLDEAVDHSLG